MATDVAQETTEPAALDEQPSEDPTPQTGFRLTGKKLKVLLLLAAVMAVQVAVGYMLLPDPADSQTNDPDGVADSAIGDPEAENIKTVEVPVGGPFNVTNGRAAPGSVIHVSFKLTAIVAAAKSQEFQDTIKETHDARIRAAVVKVIRSSSLEELNDPDSNVMKRQIREEMNKVLQKDYVIEVVLGEIRLMPQ